MKNKNQIVYFLQEIAIVVVGVLIAVSIGNYKEKMDNKKYIQKTLSAIENEINLSQEEVNAVLIKHTNLIDSLSNKIYDNEQNLGEIIGNLGGVQFPLIKNVSLRFFISNKAELVDFELISQLLEIEEQTNMLSDKMKRLADYTYDNMNDKKVESKIKFAYLLANVIDTEETLLESYSVLLEEKSFPKS